MTTKNEPAEPGMGRGNHSGLKAVQARISAAAATAQRSSSDITLIAISKTVPTENVQAVIEAGHRVFGENRVQEAQTKWPSLKRTYPGLELHLVGPLQTNKAADAISLFDSIHTLDRPKLAKVIASELIKQKKQTELFVQVNTGEEAQKAGVAPGEADQFIDFCRSELGLRLAGLMCIPPIDEEAALHFALLEKIAKRNGLRALSMGMSGDIEKAIAFGATHVRVGTAIFGHRPSLPGSAGLDNQ